MTSGQDISDFGIRGLPLIRRILLSFRAFVSSASLACISAKACAYVRYHLLAYQEHLVGVPGPLSSDRWTDLLVALGVLFVIKDTVIQVFATFIVFAPPQQSD